MRRTTSWHAAPLAICVGLTVAGCNDGMVALPGSNTHSRILALQSVVRQPDPSGMFPGGVRYDRAEDQLRAAALVHLRGMTRDQALATLAADGFTCLGASCSSTVRERETWVATMGIRPPGPLHIFTLVYSVTVIGDVVSQMSDLTATITSSRGAA
ncbi:hypothetical protein RNZ50_23605 [Paracoccaceae bacterium Fryx2]|nr:hypothetical protein [Paracoccaceae bacterium Fryx2]